MVAHSPNGPALTVFTFFSWFAFRLFLPWMDGRETIILNIIQTHIACEPCSVCVVFFISFSLILIIIYTNLRRMEIDVDVARMVVRAYCYLLYICIAMASTRWCNHAHGTLAFLLHTRACTPANLRCDDGWQPLSTWHTELFNRLIIIHRCA